MASSYRRITLGRELESEEKKTKDEYFFVILIYEGYLRSCVL